MEDLDKYVFDPENPRSFEVYNLFLKIIRDKNNAVYIDPEFFFEIFHDEIFDDKMENALWNKPSNYSQLSGLEKKRIFIENFSLNDFIAHIREKLRSNSGFAKYNHLFNSYLYSPRQVIVNEDLRREDPSVISVVIFLESNTIDDSFWGFLVRESFYTTEMDVLLRLPYGDYSPDDIIFEKKNIICFARKKILKSIISIGTFPLVSVMITLEDDYITEREELKDRSNGKFSPSYPLKPLLLKKPQDVRKLLNFLQRDAAMEERKSAPLSEGNPTYLSSATLRNYYSVKNTHLENLSDKKEIYFVGENGDGKTILLQALLLALKGNRDNGTVRDFIKATFYKEGEEKLGLKAIDSASNEFEFQEDAPKQHSHYENVFAYGIGRFKPDKGNNKDKEGYLSLFSYDQFLENPVEWLQHLDYKASKGNGEGISLTTAKDMLCDLLERDIDIAVSPEGVTFTERGTPLVFEQLSDGYRSVMVWVCDLVARLSEKQPHAKMTVDFGGIVLVDEIDALLHPKWQFSIVRKLREWFPQIQFIFTTHSPVVVQGASEDAIFYRVYKDEKGDTQVSEPFFNKDINHLMANGILTSPLFDLETASSASYHEEDKDLVTRDYLHQRIYTKLKARMDEGRKKGKPYVQEADIDNLIDEILAAEPPAPKYESKKGNGKS